MDTGILGNFQSVTSGEVSVVWSPANYAIFHVNGTRHMPRRDPFAIFVRKFMKDAEELIGSEIAG
jgi:hypothetical protein